MTDENPLDGTLKALYEAQMNAALIDTPFMAQLEAERKARWDALTPEQQELETLRGKIRELEHRLDHARRALDGVDCD